MDRRGALGMDATATSHRDDPRRASASLLRLDPTPMDTPPSSRTGQESPSPTIAASESTACATKGGSAGAPGLSSSSGHGTMYYLMRIQRYSSYAMSIFTALHFTNVSMIPVMTRSVAGSEAYLLMTREIYQTSVSEPLLVALPVVAHVGSGIAMRLMRRWQNMARYGGAAPGLHALQGPRSGVRLWPPLSYISISGYTFALFYFAHATMNRAIPLLVEGDSSNIGLAYVAHGFARHPIVSLLAYVGLIGVGCGHMIWGTSKWLNLAPTTSGWLGAESAAVDKVTKKQRRRRWLGVHAVAMTAAAMWALGGLGLVSREGLAGGWIGKLYDDIFARVGM